MKNFKFEILHRSKISSARVGKIYTPHGVIDTPNFVAVGTNGTLKALDNEMVSSYGLQLMFCNTYHLLLQPGIEVIEKGGGLHRFIGRDLPIITDSGGFQVFSLAYRSVFDELKSRGKKREDTTVLKISEEGILFRSYRDGQKIDLTPESSIIAQKKMKADIIIPLDELPPYHVTRKDLKRSLERTHRWERRSLEEHLRDPQGQAIYAVVHGGVDKELREESCKVLGDMPFDGYAIGGSVGRDTKEMMEMLRFTLPLLPEEKPQHLLGIGDIRSLALCIPLGVDTFDSSYPTKAARHGYLLTQEGGIKINSRKFNKAFKPIEKNCSCWTCSNFTLAYLHHLFKAGELTALSLASIHNLHFMVDFMQTMRNKILKNMI